MAGKHSAQPQQTQVQLPQEQYQPKQEQRYAPQGDLDDYGYQPRKRRGWGLALLALILVAAIVGGGYYFLFVNPPFYNVTVNGNTMRVKRNETIGEVIAEGAASPVPGNLLAIDGNLCVEGGGNAFVAYVNGNETLDANTQLKKDDVVDITNGTDVTESYTETQEVLPHGTIESDTSANGYWAGSLHVYEKGQDGIVSNRVGSVSGVVLSEVVQAPIDAGYHIYTANVGDNRVIALTFDDGPWPETTDQILDILAANGARATFFTIGEQVPNYAAQVQRANAMGCQVVTHSWDHARGSGQGVNLTYMSADEQISEITRGYDILRETLGSEPAHILRAPGGNYYGDIISTLEPYVDAEIGWDVDTEDWRRPGADAIYERIMSVQPGQVILMHDGGGDRSQTVEALSRALPELVAQGYQMVTISELLALGH